MREVLYCGLHELLVADPGAHEFLVELLLPHFAKFYVIAPVMQQTALRPPPLLLDKCATIQVRLRVNLLHISVLLSFAKILKTLHCTHTPPYPPEQMRCCISTTIWQLLSCIRRVFNGILHHFFLLTRTMR